MAPFAALIKPAQPTAKDIAARRWIYVPYDRYTDRTGPLTEQPAAATGIVIVESTAKALRRPYHKKKLAVLISNMRHFALEQAAKGVKVLYHFSPTSHGQALLQLQRDRKLPPLTCMTPAERELRLDLAIAIEAGLQMNFVEDTTWASTSANFLDVYGPYQHGKSFVMDRFYRKMRQHTGILMDNAKPVGGQFSFDADNRNPYRGQIPIPTPPSYPPDAVTEEVLAMVESTYPHHFGTLAGFNLPCTQADSDSFWQFALTELLPHFGPFEDAMRDDHLQLFHSKTSVLLNLGRLLALDLIRDVGAAAESGLIPMASAEGFIRQLLGWREFMRHLHEQTDGYRFLAPHIPQEERHTPQEISPDQTPEAAQAYAPAKIPSSQPAVAPVYAPPKNPSSRPGGLVGAAVAPADAPPTIPLSRPERSEVERPPHFALTPNPSPNPDPYAGAIPSALHANLPLPAVYWGVPSGLHCMDTVVKQVIDEGWSHHITRLMVLSNLANLCGFSPRELTDWFWFAYVDAYDWVVEPNVLGMATYADGGLTATKPYVSGAAYINKMSNYCGHCKYDPKKSTGEGSCPFTALYWTFLERNEATLGKNFRLQMPYNTLHKKAPADLVQLRARAADAIAHLQSFPRPTY